MDTCYHYSPETGEYLGASTYRRDPLENLPLIPAHATETAPPDYEAGWIPVYASGAWTLAEDHRGEAGFVNGEAVTITGLGPLPEGWSTTAPLPTLEQAKADKLVEARDKMEDFLKSQVSEYCDCEKQTWDQQAAEADALAVDPEAPAPLVRAIAAYRGMTVESLVQRIQANAAVWKAMAGGVTGQRLAFFDRVAAAETVEEVRSIAISYSIPAEVAGIQLYYQSLRG